MTKKLFFLKLGGSLITDKDQPHTARPYVIDRLAQEIAAALAAQPDLGIVLGHGSGSFGHVAAKKYGTRRGVNSQADWMGFAEVWKEARALNQIVVESLADAGIPVIALPPSAAVTANDGQPEVWSMEPIEGALEAGIVPLINGDVIFDRKRGGTILSTEDLFLYLARRIRPQRILLAGREDGVWEDFPHRSRLIDRISPDSFGSYAAQIGGSASIDVTGGMLDKVRSMLDLAKEVPGLQAEIFSGLEAGNVYRSLLGEVLGTTIGLAR